VSARAYDLAIFDFDGTLADTAEWMFGVLNALARRHRFPKLSAAEAEMLRGRTNREIISYLKIPQWRLPFIARDGRAMARRDRDAIRLFPEAVGTLEALKAAGVKIAIVSSNSEDTIRHVLAGRASLVDHYGCGASLFGKAKKLRKALAATGTTPGRAVAIGDEVRDVEAARAAGIDSGAVLWGYATRQVLAQAEPTFAVDSFSGLASAVTGSALSAPT
jgi:phosphoglycolate phosphatase